jgi:hypothetical protein
LQTFSWQVGIGYHRITFFASFIEWLDVSGLLLLLLLELFLYFFADLTLGALSSSVSVSLEEAPIRNHLF